MKTKVIISFLVGGLTSVLAYHTWLSMTSPSGTSTTDHWRAIESYNAYIRNPSNAKTDQQTGLSHVAIVDDIEPHLAALVAAGELSHLDIVLPTVSSKNYAATRHWMSFCERHPKDIVHVTGDPRYTAFPTKEEQPLHLNIWFRDTSEPVVQQLISELEEMGSKEESTTSATAPE